MKVWRDIYLYFYPSVGGLNKNKDQNRIQHTYRVARYRTTYYATHRYIHVVAPLEIQGRSALCGPAIDEKCTFSFASSNRVPAFLDLTRGEPSRWSARGLVRLSRPLYRRDSKLTSLFASCAAVPACLESTRGGAVPWPSRGLVRPV